MSPDKDKLLCEKYPKLFAERNLPMTETCMCWGFEHGDGWFNIIATLCANIQHHIDYGNDAHERASTYNEAVMEALSGNWQKFESYWATFTPEFLANAKDGLMENAKAVLKDGGGEDALYMKVPPKIEQVVVGQVKEKFGTLRFYYTGGDERVEGMVAMAEAMSSCTCELCGCPGESNTKGWLSVLCKKCRATPRPTKTKTKTNTKTK